MTDANAQAIWGKVWARDFTHEENRLDIQREGQRVRWKKIRSAVLKKFDSFDNLKVIEIGSGRGIYSLLFSREGAQAYLLDDDALALKRAGELFDEWGQSFQSVAADAFALPPDSMGKFDIAMSYGLAEHFRYPERFQIFESHLRLLRPGGLLIVSVPNRAFLPYRIGKFLLEALHKWELGLEIPFSRGELQRIAKRLGLKNWQIIGSGFVADTLNFWFTQRLFHLPGFLWQKAGQVMGIRKEECLPLKDRNRYFSYDPSTALDDYLGYGLVLIGEA